MPTASPPATIARVSGERIDPPAVAGSLAPSLALVSGEVYLSWLEPAGSEGKTGHRLRVARLEGEVWADPVTVVEGEDFFANWADFPTLVEAGDGSLLIHWLAKTGQETYAYSIFLARSRDRGATWRSLGPLNLDDTETEHGFVSYVPEGEGVRAFWLDGRAMVEDGPMALRTAHIGEELGPSEVLDRRVCDCCSTDAAVTSAGPVVVYRDRSETEVRDVAVIGRRDDAWLESRGVASDGWTIAGCPVNGPEIAAEGDAAAVAWFSGAHDVLRVSVAFSADAAASFGEPVVLDEADPLGRVDVVLDADGSAIASWLAVDGDAAALRLCRASADGGRGAVIEIARTGASRSSGFPRLLRHGGTLYLSWVDTTAPDGSRLRLLRLPGATVPQAA